MYNDFFGLKASPFELSPDPYFMFSSEKSKEALTSISGAVGRRKGFVVLTGEVGTGKTLILRCLFELWEREQIPFAYFIGPRLSTTDFLSYINFELGIEVAEPTKGNLLRALYGFLLAQFEKGLTTVLVIDEAHQVPRSVLEEIRLLTNFETAQQKLVQILLVGQPELDKKLDSAELRSLKQRIAVRCQLEALRREESRSYIERRLELAGADTQATTIFPEATVNAIYKYSQGIPRLINNICDQALMAAYYQHLRVVPVGVIDEVASRYRLEASPDVQTEASSSLDNPIDGAAANNPQHSLTAQNAQGAKGSESDAIIMYLDEDNSALAQTGLRTRPGESAPTDFVPYTRKVRQQTIDREKIREFLTEFDSQTRKAEPDAVSFDLSALSDALASANSAGHGQSAESAPDSVVATTTSKPAQLTFEEAAAGENERPTSLTSETETESGTLSALNVSGAAEPETPNLSNATQLADTVDTQASGPSSSRALEFKAAAAANQNALHTSAEALKLEAARLQEQLSSFQWAARLAPNEGKPAEPRTILNEPVAADDAKSLQLAEAASLLVDISNSAGMAALRANHEAEPTEVEALSTAPAAGEIDAPTTPEPISTEAPISEDEIEPEEYSSKNYTLRNKKGILTSAVAAGFLVLAAAGAQYLRRPSTPVQTAATGVDQAPAAAPLQSVPQNGAPGRGTSKGSGTISADAPIQGKLPSPNATQPGVNGASGANADLRAHKQLAEPLGAYKKSILGQVRLAKPTVNRAAKMQDAGTAPSIDAQLTLDSDTLGRGFAGTSNTESATASAPMQVGGDVKPARLLNSVSPVYPTFAKNQHVEGDVRVDALVDVNGRVTAAKAVSGPTLLQQAAVEALRQWKYQPATLDGKAVPMHLTVTLQFRIH